MAAYAGEEVQRLPNGLEIEFSSVDHLRRFAEAGYLYAVLDSCDAPTVPEKARELSNDATSLFKGSAQEDYWAVAPYLFKISVGTLDWIVATLWDGPWGVFVLSKSDLESLRAHLRRFLLVYLPDGEQWFFRYYDPRILKAYLPTCTEAELGAFLGPARAIAVASSEPSKVWLLRPSQSQAQSLPQGEESTFLWRIRPEQEQQLNQGARADFEKRVIAHLRKVFPDQCKSRPAQALQAAVHHGIERAATYHIVAQRDVCKFIDLMFTLGPGFDVDPNLPWAAEILTGEDEPDGKIAQLCCHAERLIRDGREIIATTE